MLLRYFEAATIRRTHFEGKIMQGFFSIKKTHYHPRFVISFLTAPIPRPKAISSCLSPKVHLPRAHPPRFLGEGLLDLPPFLASCGSQGMASDGFE